MVVPSSRLYLCSNGEELLVSPTLCPKRSLVAGLYLTAAGPFLPSQTSFAASVCDLLAGYHCQVGICMYVTFVQPR